MATRMLNGHDRRDEARRTLDRHAEAAGELCADDGSGTCRECGVSMSRCDECGGTGYHRPACREMAVGGGA